jgi:hypothetical protein
MTNPNYESVRRQIADSAAVGGEVAFQRLEALVEALPRRAMDGTRTFAFLAMAESCREKALPYLAAKLVSRWRDDRINAMRALGWMNDPTAFTFVVNAYHRQADAEMRSFALEYIGDAAGRSRGEARRIARSVVKKALRSRSPELRSMAICVAAQLNMRETMPCLMRLTRDQAMSPFGEPISKLAADKLQELLSRGPRGASSYPN